MEEKTYPQAETLRKVFDAARAVSTKELNLEGKTGLEVGEMLKKARIAAIRQARASG